MHKAITHECILLFHSTLIVVLGEGTQNNNFGFEERIGKQERSYFFFHFILEEFVEVEDS